MAEASVTAVKLQADTSSVTRTAGQNEVDIPTFVTTEAERSEQDDAAHRWSPTVTAIGRNERAGQKKTDSTGLPFQKEDGQTPDVTVASLSDAEEDQDSNTSSSEHENPTDVLNNWITSTKRTEITLVTAGKSGSGKSSLIANMFGLEGENAPKINHSPSSVSMEVEVFERQVNGITLRIIDTPGLGASDVEEARIISQLQKATQGKADMLLYCVSILPTSKIDKPDEEIVKKLTYAFGKDCWKQAILVFTFANMVKRTKHKAVIGRYSEKFQEVLRGVCSHYQSSYDLFRSEEYSIVPIYSCNQSEIKRSPNEIIALPAGEDSDEELIDGTRWDDSIYMEVLKKCNPEAIPALLKVKGPTPKLIRLGLELGGFTAVGAVGGVAGAVAGGIVGSAIGAGVGLFLGGAGVIPGAVLGGKIGAGIVGGTLAVGGGLTVMDDLFEYEAKQAERSKLHEEIQEYEQQPENKKDV